MKHLYNAATKRDEDQIKNMVCQTISTLRHMPEQSDVWRLGFDAGSANILAGLLEIGVAPKGIDLPATIRDRAKRFGSVQIQISRQFATELANQIEVGMLRHENGVNDPSTFVLH